MRISENVYHPRLCCVSYIIRCFGVKYHCICLRVVPYATVLHAPADLSGKQVFYRTNNSTILL